MGTDTAAVYTATSTIKTETNQCYGAVTTEQPPQLLESDHHYEVPDVQVEGQGQGSSDHDYEVVKLN